MPESREFVGRDALAGVRDHVGDDEELVPARFLAHAGAIGDRGMALQHALDLVGRDAVAEALDDVVLAAEEPQVAVRIVSRVVAGEEPAVVTLLGRLLGEVPVAQEEPGVGLGDADHALLAGGDLLECFRVEQPDVVAGLGEPGAARADRAQLALRQVVAELAHAHRLEDVEAEALLPQAEHLVGEMLAGAHAVAQRGHVGARERGFLQYLSVDGRHADEDRRAVLRDEARPRRGVVLPLVGDHRLAAVERIHERRAQHVGPVELARMDDAVDFPGAVAAALRVRRPGILEIEPVRRRGRAPDERAVAVEDPFRVTGGPRGVDEVGGIVDRGIGRRFPPRYRRERALEVDHLDAVEGQRLAGARQQRESQRLLSRELGAHRLPGGLVDDDRLRSGIVGEVLDFLGGEERRGRHAHRPALHGAQEGGRIVDGVGQTYQHALAGSDAEIAKQLREAAGALGEGAVGDGTRAQRIVFDDHRHPVGRGRAQVRVGAGHADVQSRGDLPRPGRERRECGAVARGHRMTP